MGQVLFDVDNVDTNLNEQFKPNVLDKFVSEAANFRGSSSYSSLSGYSRCGISSFVSTIEDRMVKIDDELKKIYQYVSSSIGNYRGLENRLLERGGSSQIDSDSLSSCLTSVIEISKFVRDYKSEDSMAYLEYKPKYTSLNSSSVVSGQSQKQSIYGNSVSKHITDDNAGYSVSSVYKPKGDTDYSSDTEEEYSVSISDFFENFSTTPAKSVINFNVSSNYSQGESINK